MLTLKQFATKAKLPESHIRKLAQEGTLQSEKIANNWVIYDHMNALPSQKGKRIQQSTLNTISQIITKNEVEFKHAQHKQHIYKLIQEFYENPTQKAHDWRYRNGVTLLKLAVPELVLEQIEKKYSHNKTGLSHPASRISSSVLDIYMPAEESHVLHSIPHAKKDVHKCNLVVRLTECTPTINEAMVAFDLMNDYSQRSHTRAQEILKGLM